MRSKLFASALLTALHLGTGLAEQHAVIETTAGEQLSGTITFAKEQFSLTPEDGKRRDFPIDQLQLVTLILSPDHQQKPVEIPRNGLRGRYYSNIKHEDTPVERIDPTISFDWGEASPIEGVRPNGFSVRWEGEVESPVSGEITFEVESDDGNRLWVDGKKLTDHWQAQSATTHSGKIKLEANRRYPIKLEYYDAWNTAIARLRWKADGLPRQIIPAKHLFPLALNDPKEGKREHEVHLKSGSILSGKIVKADTRRVMLETGDGPIVLPMPAVSFMKFTHSWGTDLIPVLQDKPPGISYMNRDFAEGKFISFADGIAEMESVLFGKQSIQQSELRAIKVRPQDVKPARLWILTTSDSRLIANTIETVADGRLKIRDASGYHIPVPGAQIRQIRFARLPENK